MIGTYAHLSDIGMTGSTKKPENFLVDDGSNANDADEKFNYLFMRKYLFGLTQEQAEKLEKKGRIWLPISEDPIS